MGFAFFRDVLNQRSFWIHLKVFSSLLYEILARKRVGQLSFTGGNASFKVKVAAAELLHEYIHGNAHAYVHTCRAVGALLLPYVDFHFSFPPLFFSPPRLSSCVSAPRPFPPAAALIISFMKSVWTPQTSVICSTARGSRSESLSHSLLVDFNPPTLSRIQESSTVALLFSLPQLPVFYFFLWLGATWVKRLKCSSSFFWRTPDCVALIRFPSRCPDSQVQCFLSFRSLVLRPEASRQGQMLRGAP